MRILVACEESQTVCKAFRAKGHEAYSCDLVPCSGGHPEWHIQCDVLEIIGNGDKQIATQDGDVIWIQSWDMIIGHPPCIYLANSGVSWLFDYKGESLPDWEVFGLTGYSGPNWKKVNIKRFIQMRKAATFFRQLLLAPVQKLCLENPIQHKYARDEIIFNLTFDQAKSGMWQYDQVIQPWMFGHPEQKATCLWLKGLPKLYPTSTSLECQNNRTFSKMMKLPKRERERLHYLPPSADRQKIRSKTFDGIALAMSEQWG